MKKLLYILLAVSIIFSACEEDTPLPASNSNNNSALAIGDSHQGGIIFWLDGNGGGLVAAPSDQSLGMIWGCFQTDISGAAGTAIGTGAQNTIDIVNAGCIQYDSLNNGYGDLTPADICANLTLGGYSDWFLPSKDELNQMYLNIGEGDSLGLGNIGNFATGGGDFYVDGYWSSSEYDKDAAWLQNFAYGGQSRGYEKGEIQYVNVYTRAVRAF